MSNDENHESKKEQLRKRHEEVEIQAPRWALELLVELGTLAAEDEDLGTPLREDCQSASAIIESRLEDTDE